LIAMLTSDLMQDIENAILALAQDKIEGIKILEEEGGKVFAAIEKRSLRQIFVQLEHMAIRLSKIKLREPLKHAKVISLTGEIYVRREEFSRIDLIKRLAEKGFVVRSAPISEYFYYCNYLIYKGSKTLRPSLLDRIRIPIMNQIQIGFEKKIKNILSKSGLIHDGLINIEKTIAHANHLISEDLAGEAILTVGSALREIIDESCGVISIGPFACMPSRLAESILSVEMSSLPFLSIETDGNAFPQIIQSKLEIFMLQAERFHGTKRRELCSKT